MRLFEPECHAADLGEEVGLGSGVEAGPRRLEVVAAGHDRLEDEERPDEAEDRGLEGEAHIVAD